jgi:SAM-dependent methyltransferase
MNHLGGSALMTHIDEGALSWCLRRFPILSFLDIGCSVGGMVELAKRRGLRSLGIDGDPACAGPGVMTHDFCSGPANLDDSFDLGWSVEFVEHVEERFLPHYLRAFNRCSFLVMTHAPPGHGGHHHVNCRTPDYWLGVMAAVGWRHDAKLDAELRKASTMGRAFMRETGMFFSRGT